MQHGHSPLPREGGALANIPDRVFDRGARRESVIAPDDAAFESPQLRDVLLASGAVACHRDQHIDDELLEKRRRVLSDALQEVGSQCREDGLVRCLDLLLDPQDEGGDSPTYCASRFRSYDPTSGTYLGYDGLRHPCPRLPNGR